MEERDSRRRLAWSTAIFSLATGLSRILGLVREIVAKRYFGVDGPGINAFTVAFQVPNLVRALLADAAISSAFVPVFSELLERGDRLRRDEDDVAVGGEQPLDLLQADLPAAHDEAAAALQPQARDVERRREHVLHARLVADPAPELTDALLSRVCSGRHESQRYYGP